MVWIWDLVAVGAMQVYVYRRGAEGIGFHLQSIHHEGFSVRVLAWRASVLMSTLLIYYILFLCRATNMNQQTMFTVNVSIQYTLICLLPVCLVSVLCTSHMVDGEIRIHVIISQL